MRCPKCDQPTYYPPTPCPHCHFSGDPTLIEELAHIEWMLGEVDTWPMFAVETRQSIQQKYQARQRELEIELGLRLPVFTPEEAREAWPELFQLETLLQQISEWLEAGLLNSTVTQTVVDQVSRQAEELRQQLEGHIRPQDPQTDADHLDLTNFLLEAVEYLSRNHGFVTSEIKEQVQASLLAEQERLEIKLGLRPASESASTLSGTGQRVSEVTDAEELIASPEPTPPLSSPQPAIHAPAPLPDSSLPHQPAAPVTPLRERLWRTLLSERTLQALLFLGIFLLFAAALSFVVWGWQDFSAPLRVAIPTGFTAIFFALGWYVRTKTPLYRSGIALSAIAGLLVPIDFYTVYANFDIPPNYWPSFWVLTSLASLTAYIIATLIIRSRFFGYLVGVAAGSLVLALIELGHQFFGLSLDWRTAGLSGLALCLIIVATRFNRSSQEPVLRVFSEPFYYLSLLTVGALMPLTFGWRFIGRDTYDTLHTALTINWCLGGFIFGWGAVYYRSHSLGLLAAFSLPVATYLAQAAIFNQAGVNPAWHAFGWALLVPLYFIVGYKLLTYQDDPIIHGHGRTAVGWGIALLIIAALWSLTDITNGAAAASSHAILAGAVILAVFLWQQPVYFYAASLLSLSAMTFAMTELELALSQLTVGWASLAIGHIIVAINVGNHLPVRPAKFTNSVTDPQISPESNHSTDSKHSFTRPLVIAGYAIALVALLPSLFPYDGQLLAYALGNWLGLAAWGARLAHAGQPGFVAAREDQRKSIFHWFTALPLPMWIWLLFANQRPLDFSLPIALAVLAWALVALSYRLKPVDPVYRWPWYLTGLLVSVIAPLAALAIAPDSFALAFTLLLVGALYLADAMTSRQSQELAPGGLVTAGGYLLLLDRLGWSFDALNLALALLVAIYIGVGLWLERRAHRTTRPAAALFNHRFLTPLYLIAHLLALILIERIYARPLGDLLADTPWTDEMRLWGAASQIVLAVIYGLYAWGTYKERWGHVAAWLSAAGGGFIAITLSRGHGSSAAEAALMAIIFVLTERGLFWLRRWPGLSKRKRGFIRLTWRLYKRPLLVAGWTVSAGAVGLALVRNLWLLGGGRIQQIWAIVGLLLIVGLYTLSARLFRQARFVWLAALLIFAPWTLLTHLGWFTVYRPTLPGYALSWMLLAWGLFLLGLQVERGAGQSYALPLKSVAHLLIPFALLWGVANVPTSRFTFALAIGLYGLAAWRDHRLLKSATSNVSIPGRTKFLYLTLGLLPVWSVYLLAWLLPAARHEHYGLMLLAFGPLGLAAGQWLRRVAPRPEAAGRYYALPGYITGYTSAVVGTMLVAHEPPLLALVLLFDALLLVVSARLFRNPLWVYPAVAVAPISLLLALEEGGIAGNRHGWWLIGLASIYLAMAWALRRVNLSAYGTATLTAGFALIALGLPPSSQDQIGALGGYGSAALLYLITAFWLRQPLLLTPATALAVVPYAISLQRSAIRPEYYGLALFPGAVAALAVAWWLDHYFGSWRDFPWNSPARWPKALGDRLLGWWGLPFYGLGFGLAGMSPFFTQAQAGLIALNFLLLMPLFGWAIYRFRLRGWLLALAGAGHLATSYYLEALGWWHYPAWAWYRFLPVTLITVLVALFIERRRQEGSPLHPPAFFKGWSRPLYFIGLLDIIIGQLASLGGTEPGVIITLTHALLIGILATFWLSSWLPYLSITLGVIALLQELSTLHTPLEEWPFALASLALGYGLLGHGLSFVRHSLGKEQKLPPQLTIWELPLQGFSLGFSWGILALTAYLGLDLIGWTVRAMFGLPFHQIVEATTVEMVVNVLALLGLLYVAAAFTYRRLRLGYVAMGMLLTSWMLHTFYIQQWENVQWYAIPAGLYLLSIAYIEWKRGNKVPARWLDYAAIVLMLGSLFWQTLLFGWGYAVLLGAEGFSAFWWGSARRLRRFFYAGMLGVILATVGQLINSLRSINQWIVFGLIGLVMVFIAIIVERKLEDIKAWQEMLETWE